MAGWKPDTRRKATRFRRRWNPSFTSAINPLLYLFRINKIDISYSSCNYNYSLLLDYLKEIYIYIYMKRCCRFCISKRERKELIFELVRQRDASMFVWLCGESLLTCLLICTSTCLIFANSGSARGITFNGRRELRCKGLRNSREKDDGGRMSGSLVNSATQGAEVWWIYTGDMLRDNNMSIYL